MGLLSLDEAGGVGGLEGVVPAAIGVDYARFEVSRQVDKETSK
jgi:hypothetical protein